MQWLYEVVYSYELLGGTTLPVFKSLGKDMRTYDSASYSQALLQYAEDS